MYKVVYRFSDLQDHNHVYEVGDTYPRKGSDPTLERIRELAGSENKLGKVLIEEVAEPKAEQPKPKKRKKAVAE